MIPPWALNGVGESHVFISEEDGRWLDEQWVLAGGSLLPVADVSWVGTPSPAPFPGWLVLFFATIAFVSLIMLVVGLFKAAA